MIQILNQEDEPSSLETKKMLFNLFKLSLWGNRSELIALTIRKNYYI